MQTFGECGHAQRVARARGDGGGSELREGWADADGVARVPDLPRFFGSHAENAVSSRNFGNTIATAFTNFPVRARAPGPHRALQRARAVRRDVRPHAPPSPLGTVVLALDGDEPRLTLGDGPDAGRGHPRVAGETMTDGIEARLAEGFHTGRVDAGLPDALAGDGGESRLEPEGGGHGCGQVGRWGSGNVGWCAMARGNVSVGGVGGERLFLDSALGGRPERRWTADRALERQYREARRYAS